MVKNIDEARLAISEAVSQVLVEIAVDGEPALNTQELRDSMMMAAEEILFELGLEVQSVDNGKIIAVINLQN